MRTRRAVVTGTGVCAPVGTGVAQFWSALTVGRSGIRPITGLDPQGFTTTVGAQVLDPLRPPAAAARDGGRAAMLAMVAAEEALAIAGLDDRGRDRCGLVLGTTMGEACWIESWSAGDATAAEVPAARQLELARSSPDRITADVAQACGLGGRTLSLGAACAAGNYAIGRAADWVRAGRFDVVVACGADSFSRTALAGFGRLGALAAQTCRPFSADRDGLVLGEGAGALVIEAEDHARARGAEIIAVVDGFGMSCDAHHIVSPPPGGDGMVRAIEAALREAAVDPDDVDWFCAHGTATPANDSAEIAAVRAVFGRGTRRVPVSSLKALTGHSLGAASAIEAVACVQALGADVVPPTWGLRQADPACAWNHVVDEPQSGRIDVVVNNAAAFGGNNAAIVFTSPRRQVKPPRRAVEPPARQLAAPERKAPPRAEPTPPGRPMAPAA